jgi:NADH dehydrogenase
VTETLQLEGRPEVFVIGDLARSHDLPMLIPVAMQEARHVAHSIHNLLRAQAVEPFRYRDPGMMATIGRNSAVAQLHGLRFSGFLGWLMWLGFHFLKIVTLRARLVALVNWAFEYFFYDRPVQILVRAHRPPEEVG